jgi:hypothetical protein
MIRFLGGDLAHPSLAIVDGAWLYRQQLFYSRFNKENLMSLGFARRSIVLAIIALALPLFNISAVLADDSNFCETADAIAYGDSVEGTIDDDRVLVPFCFEGNEGDEVTAIVETIDGDLVSVVGIADSFFDEVFIEDTARNRRGEAEVVFELPEDGNYLVIVSREDISDGDTEGDFELTLTADCNGRDCAEEDQEDSPCNADQTLVYGDSARGEIVDEDIFDSYCFVGQAGDVVTIFVEATRGDLEPIVALWNPFDDAIIEQNLNSRGRDNVDIEEYELEEDMIYMIIISRVDFEDGDTEGRYSLDLEGESSGGSRFANDTGDTCNEYPLNLLSQYQWGIAGSDPDEPLLAYNVGCRGEMASTVVGRSSVLAYDIDSRGNMEFDVGDTTYSTISVDEDEWVLDTSEGDTLTLERLEDDGCDEEPLSNLIRGTWQIEGNDGIFFDYGCNGIVLITFEGDTFTAVYEFRRDDITIELEDDELVFENAEFDTGEMVVDAEDGSVLTFINLLDE